MDEAILLAINGYAGQVPALDRFMVYIQMAYFWKGLVPVLVLVALFYSRRAAESDRRAQALGTLVAVFLAIVIARLLQLFLPDVARPFNTPGLELINSAGFGTGDMGGNSSFPSDHALMFMAMAVCIFQYARVAGIALMLHAVVVISLPRMYLGLHWPSDIAAGLVLGAGLALLLQKPLARAVSSLRIDTWPDRVPVLFNLFFVLALIETSQMYIGLRNLISLTGDLVSMN